MWAQVFSSISMPSFSGIRKGWDQFQERTLAGAAGTDQAGELTGMAVQIEVIQDIEGAIAEIDAGEFDKWLHLIFLWRRE